VGVCGCAILRFEKNQKKKPPRHTRTLAGTEKKMFENRMTACTGHVRLQDHRPRLVFNTHDYYYYYNYYNNNYYYVHINMYVSFQIYRANEKFDRH